jgi:hypothetical protein
LPISAVRTSSNVLPSTGRAARAATSAGLFSATSLAARLAMAMNSSFLATKSVSLLISTSAPMLPAT